MPAVAEQRIGSRFPVVFCFLALSSPTLAKPAQNVPELDRLSREGLALHRQGHALKAADTFRKGVEAALKSGDRRRAVLFRNALAGALHSIYRHTEAIAEYESARTLARGIGFREAAAVAGSNLSSIYADAGEARRAREELLAARAELPSGSPYLGALLAQSARLSVRYGHFAAAEDSIREGLRFVDRLNDWALRANLMEDLGDLRLLQGRVEEAEDAFVEAYRIWRLHSPRGLEVSFYRLARLRMAQGRNAEAIRLLERSLGSRRVAHSGVTAWATLHRLGLAHARTGGAPAALEYFARAQAAAGGWRGGILPTAQANIAADVNIGEIAAEYSGLAASMARRGGGADLVWRSFLAVELNRAASLRLEAARALLDEPEYAELLARHRIESAAGGGGRSAALRIIERRTLPVLRDSRLSRSAIAASIKPGEALFSFKLGPERSWRWVLAGGRLSLAELPSRGELSRRIENLRTAVASDSPGLQAQSASLYANLFGGTPAAALRASRWLLSLDEELFALPFSALGVETAGRFRWLPEERELAVIPAAALLQRPRRPRPPGRLAAFGDPIYNPADPRLASGAGARGPHLVNASFVAPRLAGSGAEVRRAAAVWRGLGAPAEVYLGGEVTPEAVRAAVERGAGIVHIASHVLDESGPSERYALAGAAWDGAALRSGGEVSLRLTLDREGRPTALRPAAIRRLHVPASLIVLSGCSSGRGVVQSAAGLLGLSRAWLAAGARAMIGSLWPVSDGRGEFFERFYGRLGAGATPSRALREAQVSMIRSGSWRSQPRHWAAWFLTTSE